MNSFNIQVCSAAAKDFTESLCWYAERSTALATDFESEFDAAIQRIAESPELFPAFDERHRYLQLRRFPFLIIYRIIGTIIIVIAVAHTARSPGFWDER
ncbi:Plasmid stabilization system protein [Planctopirus ephydatiae]|uniref:Plasmid stabilization system protein n=1 Tax=Planctopirus ephydatiae TaxID=2528019 RepID=A0A518GRV9_9PLAN|nr:type II toxin-antitoxin system RelE/ParE family toxin [Planctopirus ephydatiae]QDV31314.1 Plasmid stabilization system protein [Planctopirus ephydatiae]